MNVLGTENVLAACQEHGIRVLVYTSTPSVVIAGDDIVNGDESLPYAAKFLDNYTESKAAAEQLVLQANNTLTSSSSSVCVCVCVHSCVHSTLFVSVSISHFQMV